MATIKGHSYKPNLFLFLTDGETESDVFTFGFELETEHEEGCQYEHVQNKISDFLTSRFGNDFTDKELFYFKRDGSLINGCEIVSQPMSLKWFLLHKQDMIDFFSLLNSLGFSSHENERCGLHFHIGNKHMESNRIANSNSEKEKQLAYVAENMNMILNYYQNEFLTFSRRSSNQVREWCKFSETLKKDFKKQDKDKYVDYTMKHKGCGDRYHALNLTNPSTIELRLMRGTLKFETFFITFNLVNNFANMCLQEHKLVTWNNLLTDNLNDEYTEYAIHYMEDMKTRSRYRALEFRTVPIFTKDNLHAREKLANRYLESLGLI